MGARTTGIYEESSAAGERVPAFIPHPLPPIAPPLDLQAGWSSRLREAEQSLVRLDLAGEMVPSLDWFIYAFVRKEAVLSSQIEGTQATLVDLLSLEAAEDSAPLDPDVEEVCNYLDALRFARAQLAAAGGLPLSIRLLNETHRHLMKGARGADKLPGELRRSQNWIGGSRPAQAAFVPPPPHLVPELLGALERYIHSEDALPPLLRIGLVHVQFETIHPYLDGNGRLGRLLVTLLLEQWGLLRQPLLYLSLFFKRHRQDYYRRLGAVRTDGDWEGWLAFFLEGIETVATEAVDSARQLFALVSRDRERVLTASGASVTALRLFEALPRHPVLSVARAMQLLGASKPTANKAVDVLLSAGVLAETSGRKRGRSFVYRDYLERLKVGTELETPGR